MIFKLMSKKKPPISLLVILIYHQMEAGVLSWLALNSPLSRYPKYSLLKANVIVADGEERK